MARRASARSRRVAVAHVIAGLLLLPASAPAAITLTEGVNTVVTPRFQLDMGNTLGVAGGDGNVERVDTVQWKDSAGTLGANLTAPGLSGFCPTGTGPGHFWGQSYADHDGGAPLPVMAGNVGNWDPIGARTVELNSVAPTACSGSTPTIPVRTRYSFYDSAAATGSMIRVERRWAFGPVHPSFSPTHGLRAYVPRLAVGTYDQVIYPKADESGLITTSSAGPAFPTDWNGKWVALNSSSSNSGLLILRDPGNTSPATVVTDNDGGSNSNLSGVTLVRPLTGWQAPLTETEYLCFYDANAASWPVAGRSATNLPQGCSARPLPINTSPPTVAGGAGNPLPGANLTASSGTWENSTGSFSFQWLRCEGASCTEIGGATNPNYTATGDDVGKSLKVRVTATAANGEQDSAQSSLAGSVSGTVYQGTTATPLAGARVQACRVPSGGCRTATTDGAGGYHLRVPESGNYALKAFPPSSSSAIADTDSVTVLDETDSTAPDLILQIPQPPPASVRVGGSGFRGTAPGGVPVVHWNVPFSVTVDVSAGPPGTQVEATLETPGGDIEPIDEDFTPDPDTPDGDDGSWEFDFPATNPLHGNGFVRITIIPPTPEDPDGEIVFPVYIDPSGIVRMTDGAALSGATMTLLRSDFPAGPFTVVPDGSDVMSPSNRRNPDLSDQTGRFGWDVIAGFYKVRAEKAGCHAPSNAGQPFVETAVMEIPPPVTDLDIRLECPAPVVVTPEPTPDVTPDPTPGPQPDPSPGAPAGPGVQPGPVPRPVADTSPPNTKLTSGPRKRSTTGRARFSFTSTEPGSSFRCSLDRGAFKSCRSPKRVVVKRGKHTFRVQARDAAGNVDPTPAKATWTYRKKRARNARG